MAPIRILLLEDNPSDAELIRHRLDRDGFAVDWTRVARAAEFADALAATPAPDVILSDFDLPDFDGLAALELVQERGLEIPFILVSGAIGDERAVQVLKRGAADYVLKDHLERLGDAISRALDERDLRALARRAEAENRYLVNLIATVSDAIFSTDLEFQIQSWNPGAERIYGWRADAVIGKNARALLQAEYPTEPRAQVMRRLLETGHADSETIQRRQDGAPIWIHSSASLITNGNGKPTGMVAVNRDITDRKQAEQKLQEQAELLDLAHDAIIVRDLESRILFWNTGAAALYGWSKAQAANQIIQTFLKTQFPVSQRAVETALLRDGKWDGELIHIGADGRSISVASRQALRRDEHGNPSAILEINHDITDRKRAEERLRYTSTHDGLTELYNRAYYEEELHRLERSRRFPVGIVIADLNNLKMMNDRHGHAAGDLLLKRAARVLQNAFRAEDIVARIGGDEFAVLLPATNADAIRAARERIHALQHADDQTYPGLPLRFALGVAIADNGPQLPDALKQADARMYEEKAQSKT